MKTRMLALILNLSRMPLKIAVCSGLRPKMKMNKSHVSNKLIDLESWKRVKSIRRMTRKKTMKGQVAKEIKLKHPKAPTVLILTKIKTLFTTASIVVSKYLHSPVLSQERTSMPQTFKSQSMKLMTTIMW